MSINFKTTAFAKPNLVTKTGRASINKDLADIRKEVDLIPKLINIKVAIERSSAKQALKGMEAIPNINQVLEISEEELNAAPARKFDIYNTNVVAKVDKIQEEVADKQAAIFSDIDGILADYRNTATEFSEVMKQHISTVNREQCESLLNSKEMPTGSVIRYIDHYKRYMFSNSASAFILSYLQHAGSFENLRPFDFATFVKDMPRSEYVSVEESDNAVFMKPIAVGSNLKITGWSGTSILNNLQHPVDYMDDYCAYVTRWMDSVRSKIGVNKALVDKTPAFISLKNIVNSSVHDEKLLMSMLYNLFN